MKIRTSIEFAIVAFGFALGIAGCGAKPLRQLEPSSSASSAATEQCNSPSAGCKPACPAPGTRLNPGDVCCKYDCSPDGTTLYISFGRFVAGELEGTGSCQSDGQTGTQACADTGQTCDTDIGCYDLQPTSPSAGTKSVAPTQCPPDQPKVTGNKCCYYSGTLSPVHGTWQLKPGPNPGPEPFECKPNP